MHDNLQGFLGCQISKEDVANECSSLSNPQMVVLPSDSASSSYSLQKEYCIRHHKSTSENIFGIIHVESRTVSIQLGCSNDTYTSPNAHQYKHQTSFAFHPTQWLIKFGFNYGLRISLSKSSVQGWNQSLAVSRPVPDDALIFEFCDKGNFSGVRSLLSRGLASVRDIDSSGRTALFVSLKDSSVNIPFLCIEQEMSYQ